MSALEGKADAYLERAKEFETQAKKLSPEFIGSPTKSWRADCLGRNFEPILADTEADARAKMLIYLLYNKLITLPSPR